MKSGRPLHPDDAAPALQWEGAIWWLYCKVQTQWREGFNGRTGLDYNPAIALIKALRWPLVSTLDLLREIELEYLEAQRERRGQPGQD